MAQYIKPAGITGLNISHPLNADILHFFEFGQLDKDLVTDTSLTISNAAASDDPDIGSSRRFTNLSTVTETFPLTFDLTVLLVCRPYGTRNAGGSGMKFIKANVAGDRIWFLHNGFTGYGFEGNCIGSYGTERRLRGADFADDAAFHTGITVGMHLAQTAVMKYAYDGTIGGITDTNTTNALAAPRAASLCVDGLATDDFAVGAIVLFNRVLTDVELQSVTNNPWDLVATASTLSADSFSGGDLIEGTTRRINLSNAPSTSGRTVSIGAGALTVVDEGADYVDVLIPNLRTFGDLTGQYNVSTTFTVTDGAESDTIDGTILPLDGYEVGAITAVEGIYAEAAFSGVAVTDVYYTETISGADFTVGAVPVLGTEQTFNLWIQDQTDGAWGTPFVVTIPSSDEISPILSSPTATETGATTASGSVTTDEANGTLYYYASANSSESAATVKASGSSQAVSATGVQNVNFTGLTESTAYYAHYMHEDAATNQSNVASSAQFTTDAAPDVTAPILSSPTATGTGATSATGTVTTDDGNGTLYYYASANATELAATIIASGASRGVSSSGVLGVTFTGLSPETSYYGHYVHVDAATNQSNVVSSAQFTTLAASAIPIESRSDIWKLGRYLQSTGSYNSVGINEIVMEWLIAEGIGRSQLNYMLYLYLEGLGYTGTLNDKLRKWSLDP